MGYSRFRANFAITGAGRKQIPDLGLSPRVASRSGENCAVRRGARHTIKLPAVSGDPTANAFPSLQPL